MARAVHELVASLGWKPTLFPVWREGYSKRVKAYDVTFSPLHWNPFALPRKADLVDTLDGNGRSHRRIIQAVTPCETVPTQCIQVDSPDSLYLVGIGMIPTHNTGKQPYYLRQNMQGTAYSYASTQPEFWQSEIYPSFDDETVAGMEQMFAKMGYRLHEGTKEWWWNGPMRTQITELASRRFRWINMQDVKYADGGWRGPHDYARLRLAVEQYVKAQEAEVFSPTLDGVVCQWCEYQRTCMGVGLPEKDHGMPEKRYKTKA
jgi:hypothetical protein